MTELGVWLVAASLLSLVLAVALLPVLVTRIPCDYLSQPRRVRALVSIRHPILRLALLFMKNLVGGTLLLAGLLMLLTPGQGLLTLTVGLLLVDFPGKHAVERWLIVRPPIFRAINRLRMRRGYSPLLPAGQSH